MRPCRNPHILQLWCLKADRSSLQAVPTTLQAVHSATSALGAPRLAIEPSAVAEYDPIPGRSGWHDALHCPLPTPPVHPLPLTRILCPACRLASLLLALLLLCCVPAMASAAPKLTLRLTPTTREAAHTDRLLAAPAAPAGGSQHNTTQHSSISPFRLISSLRSSKLDAGLVLRRGDITNYDGCAIVNAANER